MDKFILGQSEVATISKDNPDITINLQLHKNKYANNTFLYGYIYNCCNLPIENANIIIYNRKNQIIN